MKYRSDRYGNQISQLGYGCMRFTSTAGRVDVDKAEKEIMAAYNAGAGSVRKFLARYPGDELDEFIEEIPFEETRFYVKRVLGSMATYQMLYGVESAPVLSCGLKILR